MTFRPAFPDGHFYSPVVDPAEVETYADRLWSDAPDMTGIDYNDQSHIELLTSVFPRYIADYDYPEQSLTGDEQSGDTRSFFNQNSQFGWLDARALFVFLRHSRPRRIVEVGSGFSTLLMADVNRRFLDMQVEITAIEPFPRPFLRKGLPGLAHLIEQKVQEVPLEPFTTLRAGDVLFIDSSHVCKTGSDVTFLLFQVLPRLAAGVRIHFHDVFLPYEYLREWVLEQGRSWNEQYLLRALLMFSPEWRVLFGSYYAFRKHPDHVARALALPRERVFGGGSFWIEKAA